MKVVVTATVGGHDFDLLAQRYATGNYQVQNCRDNKAFFAHLKTLGADISYITLENGVWTQVVGGRTLSLSDGTAIAKKYHTTFTLSAAPSLPQKE